MCVCVYVLKRFLVFLSGSIKSIDLYVFRFWFWFWFLCTIVIGDDFEWDKNINEILIIRSI